MKVQQKNIRTLLGKIAALIICACFSILPTNIAKADSTHYTVNYVWKNSDPEGTAPSPASQIFGLNESVIYQYANTPGYTIDNASSTYTSSDPDGEVLFTEAYQDFLAKFDVTSIEDFFAKASGQQTIQEAFLGFSEQYTTVLIPNDETVTIKYLETGSNKELKNATTIQTKFSRTVVVDHPDIAGYTVAANQPTSYKVDKDGAGKNVVTVYYDKVPETPQPGTNEPQPPVAKPSPQPQPAPTTPSTPATSTPQKAPTSTKVSHPKSQQILPRTNESSPWQLVLLGSALFIGLSGIIKSRRNK